MIKNNDMTAQCNNVGSTVLAITLNYLIQKIIHTVLKAQWDGELGSHSQQHRQRQQQHVKGTVPGKSDSLSLSEEKSQPSITSCEVVLRGQKFSQMWIFSSRKNDTRQQTVIQPLLRPVYRVRQWHFHCQMLAWLRSKRIDFSSLSCIWLL